MDLKLQEVAHTSDSNRQILTGKIDNLEKNVMTELVEIKTQTVKTNGRVTKLEQYQYYVVGFCAAVSMMLIPVLVFLAEKRI